MIWLMPWLLGCDCLSERDEAMGAHGELTDEALMPGFGWLAHEQYPIVSTELTEGRLVWQGHELIRQGHDLRVDGALLEGPRGQIHDVTLDADGGVYALHQDGGQTWVSGRIDGEWTPLLSGADGGWLVPTLNGPPLFARYGELLAMTGEPVDAPDAEVFQFGGDGTLYGLTPWSDQLTTDTCTVQLERFCAWFTSPEGVTVFQATDDGVQAVEINADCESTTTTVHDANLGRDLWQCTGVSQGETAAWSAEWLASNPLARCS